MMAVNGDIIGLCSVRQWVPAGIRSEYLVSNQVHHTYRSNGSSFGSVLQDASAEEADVAYGAVSARASSAWFDDITASEP